MLRDLCLVCNQPVNPQDIYCNHCGVYRGAPKCPRCSQPVADTLDRFTGLDHYTWNSYWNCQCVCCGYDFSAKLELETGHTRFFAAETETEWGEVKYPYQGKSKLEISGQESVCGVCDYWEHIPMIEIRIKRAVGANCGDRGLSREEYISLTPEELQAIFAQLQGSLQVLMERKQWTRDTT